MNNFDFYENVQYVKEFDYASACNLSAGAFDNDNYDFVQVVAGVEKVRKAACYQLASGEVICGVLTEPLFSLTERLTLQQTIQKTVADITKKQVYVTLDTDIFVQIGKCKDDNEAEKIKQLIIVRNNARM